MPVSGSAAICCFLQTVNQFKRLPGREVIGFQCLKLNQRRVRSGCNKQIILYRWWLSALLGLAGIFFQLNQFLPGPANDVGGHACQLGNLHQY